MSRGPEGGSRLFSFLLRSYPPGFRDRFGTDLRELFEDRRREAGRRGRSAVAWLWVRTVPSMVVHGLLERIASTDRDSGVVRSTLVDACRRVVRAPGLSATIVVTLGLAIGANVALFSLVQGVLLRPLPYPEPDRIVRVWETAATADDDFRGVAPLNAVDWAREADGFEAMATWYLTSGTYRGTDWVEEVRTAQVTPDFFRVLGVEPALGRDFRTEEVDRYGPLMLSHGFWMRRFGGDPSVIGSTIVASGDPRLIVGVMPPDFAFPDESVEAWLAWNLANVYEGRLEYRSARFLEGIARLAPGVSAGDAEAMLRGLADDLAARHPEHNRGWSVGMTPLHDEIVGSVRGSLWLAFGSVLFILAMGCLNVANLLMARVPGRLDDVRLRVALGATRGRIVAELLTESLVLGALAGGLGVLVGAGMLEALVAIDAGGIPRLTDVGLHPPVLLFSGLVAALTTLAFGLAPAVVLLRAASPGLASDRRSSPGGRHGLLRRAFVVLQVGLALVLLTGAGLLTASFRAVVAVDPGFDPAGLASFRVSLDPVEGTADEIVGWYDGLLQAVSAVPGVTDVAASQAMPLNPVTNDFRRPFRPAGTNLASADAPTAQMRMVTPGYVETLGMRLVAGQGLPPEAELGEPLVALVNETLARQLFDGASAVGETFEVDFRDGWQPYRIAGVVADVHHYGPREAVAPEIFLSHRQVPYLAMTVLARVQGEPEATFDALEAAVLGFSSQPPHHFVSMDALMDDSVAEERFLSLLLAAFALVALALSATGVSGVVAYAVEHRRREFGVRMALGAEPETVVRSVLWDTTRLVLIGFAGGVAGALLTGRAIQGLLFGVDPTDTGTLASVGALLATVAVTVAWMQARRAGHVDPAESLRAE